jgi:hypothetical protein
MVRTLQRIAISAFIVFVIGLQAMAGARIRGPLKPDPDRWPFLSYPMYRAAHFPGEAIPRHRVFGILEDSSEVEVTPETLGTNFWIWQRRLVDALDPVDPADLRAMANLHESAGGAPVSGFRLENHPVVLSEEGTEDGPAEVIRTVWLDELMSEAPTP